MKSSMQNKQNKGLEIEDQSMFLKSELQHQIHPAFPQQQQQPFNQQPSNRNSSAKRNDESAVHQRHASNPNVQFDDKNQSIYHVPSFLVKLFEIVNNQATQDIVTWTRDGDGFVIKQPKQFSDRILPQYFKHDNFSSFIRQLNMYDFHKSKVKGSNEQIFKHPYFLEGKKNLLPLIKRKSNSSHPLRALKKQINDKKGNIGINSPRNSYDPQSKQSLAMSPQQSSNGNKRMNKQNQKYPQGDLQTGLNENQQNLQDLYESQQMQQNISGPMNPRLQRIGQQGEIQSKDHTNYKNGSNVNKNEMRVLDYQKFGEQDKVLKNEQINRQNLMDQKQMNLAYVSQGHQDTENQTNLQVKDHFNNQYAQSNLSKNHLPNPDQFGIKMNEPYQQTSFFELKDALITQTGTKPVKNMALNASDLQDKGSPVAQINDSQFKKKLDKNQFSAPRFIEQNKNLGQKGEFVDIEVDQKQRSQLKRKLSCNLVSDSEKRVRKEGSIDAQVITHTNQKSQNGDLQQNQQKELMNQSQRKVQRHQSQTAINNTDHSKNGQGDRKFEQYEFFVSDSLNNVSFRFKNQVGQTQNRQSNIAQNIKNIQQSQFRKRYDDKDQTKISDNEVKSQDSQNENQVEISKQFISGNFNGMNHQVMKQEESETASKLSVKDQIKMMISEFGNLTQNFEQFIIKQQRIEAKLRDLEREKVKQRVINDQLLYQLMKSEENKQVFEKLMTLIFQFIKEKTVVTKKDDSQVIKQQSTLDNLNAIQPQDPSLTHMQLQGPQKDQFTISNNSINDQLQQLQSHHPDLSFLKTDANGFLQPDVLDGMVSQLQQIKSSIYNEQVENANNQQLIENKMKMAEQFLVNQGSNQVNLTALKHQQNQISLQQLATLQEPVIAQNSHQKTQSNQAYGQVSNNISSSIGNKQIANEGKQQQEIQNSQNFETKKQVINTANLYNLIHSQELTLPQQQPILDGQQPKLRQIQQNLTTVDQTQGLTNQDLQIDQNMQKLVEQKNDQQKKAPPVKKQSNVQLAYTNINVPNDQIMKLAQQTITNGNLAGNLSKQQNVNVSGLVGQQIDTTSQVLTVKNDLAKQVMNPQLKPSSNQITNIMASLPANFRRASIVQTQMAHLPNGIKGQNVIHSQLANLPNSLRRASIVQGQVMNLPDNMRRASVIQTQIGQLPDNIRRASVVQSQLGQLQNNLRRASLVQTQTANIVNNIRRASMVQTHANKDQMALLDNLNNQLAAAQSGQVTPSVSIPQTTSMSHQVINHGNSINSKPTNQFSQYVITQISDKPTNQNQIGQAQMQTNRSPNQNIINGQHIRSMSISGPSQQMMKVQNNMDVSLNMANNQVVKNQQQNSNNLIDKFGNMQKLFDKGDTTFINFTENQQKQIIKQLEINQNQQQHVLNSFQQQVREQNETDWQQKQQITNSQDDNQKPVESGFKSYTLQQQVHPSQIGRQNTTDGLVSNINQDQQMIQNIQNGFQIPNNNQNSTIQVPVQNQDTGDQNAA